MTRQSHLSYAPPDDVRALFPEVSGNALNGLGERDLRRPTPIFWHLDPGLVFARLQKWIMDRFEAEPSLGPILRGDRGPRKATPIAEARAQRMARAWTEEIKAFALAHEADLVGVARLDPLWVFDGYAVEEPWIIVLGVAMDPAKLGTAPALEAEAEVLRQYNRGTRAARALANFIRANGHDARAHGGPTAGPVNLIPAALAAGFGELGKHGSIINRQFGSSFRLASVLTDLPLEPDAPERFGADEFCLSCRLCTRACPPQAIFETKQMVRGETKWYVDFDKCIPYFGETYGCGICIAVCPWSREGIAPRLAEKMRARQFGAPGIAPKS